MNELQLKKGDKAPDFELVNQNNENITLISFSGKWLVLYFYPKDNTPGCTTEAIDFTSLKKEFNSLETKIIGVSKDSVKSHINFIAKKSLRIDLLSDPEHQTMEQYGVWKLKKNYGREYMGVVRTTFLINPEGKIEEIWNSVRAKEHASKVLEYLKNVI
ncbi:MAG: thioredoxin-dependent thiol peroxidase [Candidatus Cloacimonetes bacterium]|nr:thioredoxin-dependent thiol peroxidase [Candidatus Cloacimonadota bacterium]